MASCCLCIDVGLIGEFECLLVSLSRFGAQPPYLLDLIVKGNENEAVFFVSTKNAGYLLDFFPEMTMRTTRTAIVRIFFLLFFGRKDCIVVDTVQTE